MQEAQAANQKAMQERLGELELKEKSYPNDTDKASVIQELKQFEEICKAAENSVLATRNSICSKPLRDKAMAYEEHCYKKLDDFLQNQLSPDIVLPEATKETAAGSKKSKHK
jgi:ribonuclease HII